MEYKTAKNSQSTHYMYICTYSTVCMADEINVHRIHTHSTPHSELKARKRCVYVGGVAGVG